MDRELIDARSWSGFPDTDEERINLLNLVKEGLEVKHSRENTLNNFVLHVIQISFSRV